METAKKYMPCLFTVPREQTPERRELEAIIAPAAIHPLFPAGPMPVYGSMG